MVLQRQLLLILAIVCAAPVHAAELARVDAAAALEVIAASKLGAKQRSVIVAALKGAEWDVSALKEGEYEGAAAKELIKNLKELKDAYSGSILFVVLCEEFHPT